MTDITARPPTHFVDDDGTEMVTITRARFDELMAAEEDADDLAAAVNARRSIDEEGAIPAAVSRAIRAGQNPIFSWRRYRGMTQGDLAARAEVTQAAITRLEAAPVGSGRRQTLEAIAKALDAPIDSIDPIDESDTGKMRRAIAESTNVKTGRILHVVARPSRAKAGATDGEFLVVRDSATGKMVGKAGRRIYRTAGAKPVKEKG